MKIPDHELVCRIGQGSYGEVWLARSVMGAFRAAKFVFRKTFRDQQPFQRELAGIQRFEPVSRSHPGFVHVLHVGRNEQDDYFYYLMELADDATSAPPVVPESYKPKTLSTEIARHGRLPLDDCLKLALRLTSALGHLHEKGLVHRDIKPSNIVFVEGEAKLADIGLVTGLNEARSYVGTEGFIPPEGPGSPQADIYSLGKSLYEAATGHDRQLYPELPNDLAEFPEPDRFLELNEIIVKACEADATKRYQNAEEMLRELRLLKSGGSVRRIRSREAWLKIAAKLAAVLAVVGTAAWFFIAREMERREAAREAARVAVRTSTVTGVIAMGKGRHLEALPNFIKALEIENGDQNRAEGHRMRIQTSLLAAPKLVKMWFSPRPVLRAEFNHNGSKVLIVSDKIEINDTASGASVTGRFGPPGLTDGALSPDGKRILTTSKRGAALWDLNGQQLASFAENEEMRSGRFSRDGSRIVTASANGHAFIWDDSGKLLLDLSGHPAGILFADISPDGAWVVTCGKDGLAQLWDAQTGARSGSPMQHAAAVYHASFSPDSRRLVTTSMDHTARLWRCPSGEDTAGVMQLSGASPIAQFSPDGMMILTASERTARLWSSEGVEIGLPTLPNSGHFASAAFDPTGRRILTGSSDGSVRLWDLAGSSVKPDLLASSGDLAAANFDLIRVDHAAFPTEKFIANAMRLRLRNSNTVLRASPLAARSSSPAWEVNLRAPGSLDNLWVSEDGKHVANVREKTVDIHSVSNRLEASWNFPERVNAVAFENHRPRVAIAASKQVYIRAIGSESLVEVNLPSPAFAIDFAPDGSLVTCLGSKLGESFQANKAATITTNQTDNHMVVTWNSDTGAQLAPPIPHRHNASGGYNSGNPGLLLTVDGEVALRVWDVYTGQPASLAVGGKHRYSSVNFLADGKTALAIEGGGSRVWRWQFGANKYSLEQLRALRGLLCDVWEAPERGSARIQKAWDDFYARDPKLFRVDSRDAIQWHAQMARGAMAEENWPGALHHLEILARLSPNHQSLAEDLAAVRARLKK